LPVTPDVRPNRSGQGILANCGKTYPSLQKCEVTQVTTWPGFTRHSLSLGLNSVTPTNWALHWAFQEAGALKASRGSLPEAEEFAVLVHEWAHEILHHQKGVEHRSKTVLETEAEAVSFVVCKAVGLDTNTASSDYIQLYNGKKETLMESLERIREASGKILWEV
jgi:hypothetical protein